MNYSIFTAGKSIQDIYFLSSEWYTRTMRLKKVYEATQSLKAKALFDEMTKRLAVLTSIIGYQLVPGSTRRYINAGFNRPGNVSLTITHTIKQCQK